MILLYIGKGEKLTVKSILKRFVFSFFALTAILVLSCKNSTETKIIDSETETLKEQVKNREQATTWTLEIESDRLSKKLTYSKDYFKLTKSIQKPVYPELEDFGSLNTININPNIKEKINTFCTKLSEFKEAEIISLFSHKYIFNYVFFSQDFKKGWKENFGSEFPEPAEESKDENEEEDEKKTLFTKWLLGEPFNGSNIIQLPVRFYCNYGTIDVTIYMNPNGNNEFYQITIDRWVKV